MPRVTPERARGPGEPSARPARPGARGAGAVVVVSPSPRVREAAGGPARIRAPRELDMTSSAVLVDRVRALDPGAGSVEIDLREVEFIDSFGLRALIEADRIALRPAAHPRRGRGARPAAPPAHAPRPYARRPRRVSRAASMTAEPAGLRHQALVYADEDDFVSCVGTWLREGLSAGEETLLVAPRPSSPGFATSWTGGRRGDSRQRDGLPAGSGRCSRASSACASVTPPRGAAPCASPPSSTST